METIRRNLSILVLSGFFSLSTLTIQNPQRKRRNRIKIVARLSREITWRHVRFNTIHCFHTINSFHLLAMIVLAIAFEIPEGLKGIFIMICIGTGWLFYCTAEKIICYFLSQLYIRSNVMRLHDLAGYNRKTRFLMVVCICTMLFLSVLVHKSFFIGTGFFIRWLLESQVRMLINFPSYPGSPMKFSGEYPA